MTETTAPAGLRDLVPECLEWIRGEAIVTFSQVAEWLGPRGIRTKGDLEIFPGDMSDLILWSGVSREYADFVGLLRPRTDLCEVSALGYMARGCPMLSLPLARRRPRNGYKDPHWVLAGLRVKEAP